MAATAALGCPHVAAPSRARRPPRVRPADAAISRRRTSHASSSSSNAAATTTTSGWDLSDFPDGMILSLAKDLEARWRSFPNLRDAPCPSDLKSIDATSASGDPATRMRIENLCLQTDLFRKMHLEVAHGLGGMEVLHVVMYPWAEVAAPIFAADVVAFGGRVTLCIADVSPTALDLSLPEHYLAAAKDAKAAMLLRCPEIEPRPLPEWGEKILSPDACVCVGPPKEDAETNAQATAFAGYAMALHDAHVAWVSDEAFDANPWNDVHGAGVAERLAAQARFCIEQLRNDKTRKALERSMGKGMTDRYMTEVLFDVTCEKTQLGPARRVYGRTPEEKLQKDFDPLRPISEAREIYDERDEREKYEEEAVRVRQAMEEVMLERDDDDDDEDFDSEFEDAEPAALEAEEEEEEAEEEEEEEEKEEEEEALEMEEVAEEEEEEEEEQVEEEQVEEEEQDFAEEDFADEK
jgi:hypothetical protein